MRSLAALFDRWTWTMAWRDSRRVRGRLLLFVSAMTVGVASLVAISSFGDNLESAVDGFARTMLGADFRVRSRQPFPEETEALLERRLIGELGAEESRRISFTSMAFFPEGGDTALVQVRAIDGVYPFYGCFETDPPEAATGFQEGKRALVEATLLSRFEASVGDTVRVGSIDYTIAGALLKIPGDSSTTAIFGPRVYIPLAEVDASLLQRGSRVSRYRYYRLDESVDADELRAELKGHAREHDLRLDTVITTQEWMERSMARLRGFLNLVGFVALLLGGLGVASAIHVYVRQKVGTVATLRCLGGRAGRVFAIYLVSSFCLGAIGALIGAALGIAAQGLLPLVFGDLIRLEVDVAVSWTAVAAGVAIGIAVAVAFALLPLLPLRRIPPLLALRATVEEKPPGRDRLRWVVAAAIVGCIVLYAWWQSGRPVVALQYTGGLVIAFGVLALCARLLRFAARKVLWRNLSFEWRQGLANLYRPGNQTVLLMVSIGLGAFLILTLYQTRLLLLKDLSLSGGPRPNVVLFDVQDDQVESVAQHVTESGLEVHESVPIVNMRLTSVKGRDVGELRDDRERRIPRWTLTREYRSTYRGALSDSEELVEGEWIGRADPAAGPVPISLGERIAERLRVGLGDELTWDVQGVPVHSVVASLREIDWRRVSPNFFVVFPEGVLEDAPQIHVLIARAESQEAIGALQRTTAQRFPGVSTIDVTLMLDLADELLDKLSFVVQFMSLFCILTGLLVLVSSVWTSRFQRLEESVLLRTLGARKGQVLAIMNVEFLLLGVLATLTGGVLAIGGSWWLAAFEFEIPFEVAWAPVGIFCAGLVVTTLVIGRLCSRGLHDRPPLEVLRTEV